MEPGVGLDGLGLDGQGQQLGQLELVLGIQELLVAVVGLDGKLVVELDGQVGQE